MSAFGDARDGRLYPPREGVVFHEPSGCNLLFVALRKSEKEYSPSTMYEDYALSPTEFHWQSQSTTRPETTKGQRHWYRDALGVRRCSSSALPNGMRGARRCRTYSSVAHRTSAKKARGP